MEDIMIVSNVLDHDSVFIPVNGRECKEPGVSAYAALNRPDIHVLMPNNGTVHIFVPYNENIMHVHIAVLPEFRGKLAIKTLKDSFTWIFENTGAIKIIGFEAAKNKAAIRFIGMLGVQKEGVLKNCDGQGGDMVVYGHCKPEKED